METLRKRKQLNFSKPSRTKQAFKEECDVNQILAKYQKTQLLSHVNNHQGNYGDFTSAQDYHSSVNAVMQAEEAFMALPAVVRKEFHNDPQNLIAFMSDDKNYEKAIELGLLSNEKKIAFLERKQKLYEQEQSKQNTKTKHQETGGAPKHVTKNDE